MRFGHLSTNCSSKFPVCAICAESHTTSLCTSNNKKCVNCIRFNKNSSTVFDVNHLAKDKDCPTYLYKFNLIKKQSQLLLTSE